MLRRRHANSAALIAAVIAAILAILGLAACAKFSSDGGMGVVADVASVELDKDVVAIRTAEDAASARATVQRLLRGALTADAAVQIALLNNRGLQAAYNELALAEAAMVEGSLPPNPTISLLRIAGSAEIEVERRIVADILALATLPVRSEIALVHFRQAQLRAALETVRLAAGTRRAYHRAIASRQLVGFLEQAQSAAETAAQLATRLGETGAMNKLDQAREQVFHAEVTTQLAAARQRANSEREALIRLAGLWGADLAFKLPNELPALPRRARTLTVIEVDAVRRRIDLQIARMELEALAKSFGLTQATRFINLLDAGYADKLTKDKETGARIRDRGFEVELQIPLFDFGEVRLRQAEQTYMQAVNRLAEKAVNVRSEARDAYRNYRSTYDIASHYQRDVLPLRKIISDEMMLRYGAMQVDVFSLLVEARQRINAMTAAIAAQRDFWLANTDLTTAVVGGGVAGAANEGSMPMSASENDASKH
jgi:outer membrane protein TolC